MNLQCLTDSSLPGGNDCFSLSALSESVTDNVYKYLLQRTLNFVMPLVEFFLILTLLASFLRAVSKKSLISLISFGCNQHKQRPCFLLSRVIVTMKLAPLSVNQHNKQARRGREQQICASVRLTILIRGTDHGVICQVTEGQLSSRTGRLIAFPI